eukprot:3276257-Rhodomonas_salina.3
MRCGVGATSVGTRLSRRGRGHTEITKGRRGRGASGRYPSGSRESTFVDGPQAAEKRRGSRTESLLLPSRRLHPTARSVSSIREPDRRTDEIADETLREVLAKAVWRAPSAWKPKPPKPNTSGYLDMQGKGGLALAACKTSELSISSNLNFSASLPPHPPQSEMIVRGETMGRGTGRLFRQINGGLRPDKPWQALLGVAPRRSKCELAQNKRKSHMCCNRPGDTGRRGAGARPRVASKPPCGCTSKTMGVCSETKGLSGLHR